MTEIDYREYFYLEGFHEANKMHHKIFDDILEDIERCRGKFYKNMDGTVSPYMDGTLDKVIDIIDKHIEENK